MCAEPIIPQGSGSIELADVEQPPTLCRGILESPSVEGCEGVMRRGAVGARKFDRGLLLSLLSPSSVVLLWTSFPSTDPFRCLFVDKSVCGAPATTPRLHACARALKSLQTRGSSQSWTAAACRLRCIGSSRKNCMSSGQCRSHFGSQCLGFHRVTPLYSLTESMNCCAWHT